MTQFPPPGAPDTNPATPPYGSYGAHGAHGDPQQPPQPAYGVPWGPPVPQPGVVPLRPLTLGDIFGGAIATVRRNPMATVGLAAVVTLAFMVVPMIGTVVLGVSSGLSGDLAAEDSGVWTNDTWVLIATAVSGVFSLLSSIVVTGLIVAVVEGALMGRKVTAGDAWRRGRARIVPLLGLVLLVLVGLSLVLAAPLGLGVGVGLAADSTPLAVGLGFTGFVVGLVACVFLYTRYVLLAAPSLVLEGRGVFASFARAGQLSRRSFWRLLGIYLLASLVTGLVSQVIAIPFTILGLVTVATLPQSWALGAMLLTTNISTVLTGALVGPFSAAVMALQYYDQRFRKEGLDIQLLSQALQPSAR